MPPHYVAIESSPFKKPSCHALKLLHIRRPHSHLCSTSPRANPSATFVALYSSSSDATVKCYRFLLFIDSCGSGYTRAHSSALWPSFQHALPPSGKYSEQHYQAPADYDCSSKLKSAHLVNRSNEVAEHLLILPLPQQVAETAKFSEENYNYIRNPFCFEPLFHPQSRHAK